MSDGKSIRLNTERGLTNSPFSLAADGVTNGFECLSTFDAASIPLIGGSYEITVFRSYARFRHTGSYSLQYFVGTDPRSNFGGLQTYVVNATRSVAQNCCFEIVAHSPEDAEAIVRQKPEDDFRWSEESAVGMTCKVAV